MRLRFDTGPAGLPAEFADPLDQIVAWDAADVPAALTRLDRARADGLWLAGYASYELGYALESRLLPLMPQGRRLPLLRFGCYAGSGTSAPVQPDGALRGLQPRWDAGRYAQAFQAVHDYIGAGDIYQANLTFPIEAQAQGTASGLYAALATRQSVGHGVLVEQQGGPALLSRSPELFFRTDAAGRIQTRPMKGTLPRLDDPAQDAAQRAALAADEKNQAENLMIVDLLRNDISRICQIGSVRVPDLFTVETYATVHQMVSTVEGQLLPGTGLSDILRALYPCGSITGAPKLRAMQIIRELEPWPREAYCGTIGWAAPDGRAEFNVAIRTVMLEGARATLNVGGGLVWDSTADAEYEEALWKARYAMFQPEPA
ncbi:MAG: aminodeoxychorismate synthase, component I [Rhodobacteraceae bacterium]|nr:aminodeoxychorismate synthase, component I [Paracoccaceae bacterium]MBT24957.1 aminodeoxychorismate synthase, component I [Paracoccaceae bacterium]